MLKAKSNLVCPREADGLPALDGDGDDEEDAGREGEVDAALQYGSDVLQRAELQSQVTGCWGVASSNIDGSEGTPC